MKKVVGCFWGFVGICVVLMFLISGSYGLISLSDGDREVGVGVDGLPISESELKNLIRFIESDRYDLMVFSSPFQCNLLNDGFVSEEIFKGGVSDIIFSWISEEIREEIDDRIEKFRSFSPYHFGSFGLLDVWHKFAPSIVSLFGQFKDNSDSIVGLEILRDLYLEQKKFPPELARQIIYEAQKKEFVTDDFIGDVDLSIFYAKSLNEWFGEDFVKSLALIIENGARLAIFRGYGVSDEEAHAELLRVGRCSFEMIGGGDHREFFKKALTSLKMSESDCIESLRKIMLFKKFTSDLSGHLFFDSLIKGEMCDFVSRGSRVEVYSLPDSLKLSPADGSKLCRYIHLTTGGCSLVSPSYLPLETIMYKSPQLLKKRFLVNLSHIDARELESSLSSKRIWEWMISDDGWGIISAKVSGSDSVESNLEDRSIFFSNLSSLMLRDVESFGRKEFLKAHPEIIRERLLSKPTKRSIIELFKDGSSEVLAGVRDHSTLMELLDGCSKKSISLRCYSEDNFNYYAIDLIDKDEQFNLISFQEALDRGLLSPESMDHYEKEISSYISQMYERIIADDPIVSIPRKSIELDSELPEYTGLDGQFELVYSTIDLTRKDKFPGIGENIFEDDSRKWIRSNDGRFDFFYRMKEPLYLEEDLSSLDESLHSHFGRLDKREVIKDLISLIDEKS